MSAHVGTLPDETLALPSADTDPRLGPDGPGDRPQRHRHAGSRRPAVATSAAVAVTVMVPSAVVLSMWRTLTEAFWFNEQWRAFDISQANNWWLSLRSVGAPFPAGWYFLERFLGQTFGSTELVLRAPTACLLPVTCLLFFLLARRWVPVPVALGLALAGTLTGDLISYSLQLSEYIIDAAAVIGVVLLHDIADGTVDRRTVYLAYGGMAVACVFSTPAIFVTGPLLLLDVFRQFRRHDLGARTIAAVVAGSVALAHILFFVMPQNAVSKRPFWDGQFAPRTGVGPLIAFVWDGLRGFVTGSFTDLYQPHSSVVSIPNVGGILSALWVVLLCLAVVALARSSRGRALLVAVGGSLALTLVASFVRSWPFGFARTNLWVEPLLVLMAGIGAVEAARWLAGIRLGGRDGRWPFNRSARIARTAMVAVVAVGTTALALALLFDVVVYAQLHGNQPHQQYGVEERTAVATVNREARRGDALVVIGPTATPGWRYYQYEYDGLATRTGAGVPADRTIYLAHHGSPRITELLKRVHPSELFLYVTYGTNAREVASDVGMIAKGGLCHHILTRSFASSGLLITFVPSSSCVVAHAAGASTS